MNSPLQGMFDQITTLKFHLVLFFCLLPVGLVSAWQFGLPVIVMMTLTVMTAWGANWILSLWKKEPYQEDGSALLWGLLLAYLMPPKIEFFVPMLGAIFAVWGIKGLLGGIGASWINPILAAWAFCYAAWPASMTSSTSLLNLSKKAILHGEAVTSLSLLSVRFPSFFDQGVTQWLNKHCFSLINVNLPEGYIDLITGTGADTVGGGANLLLLAATMVLLTKKYLVWEIPFFFFFSFAILTAFFGGLPFQKGLFTGDVLFQVFSGHFLLGIFFLAGEASSRPLTKLGLCLYACGCGTVTFFLRMWGLAADATGYAILLMNCFVPLLDHRLRRKNELILVRKYH